MEFGGSGILNREGLTKKKPESVVINDFYDKTGAWEGTEQRLILLAFSAYPDPLFCSSSRHQGALSSVYILSTTVYVKEGIGV